MAEFTQTMSGDSRYSIKLTVTESLPSDYLSTNKTNVNYTLTATKSAGSGYWNNNANNPITVTINNSVVVSTTVAYDFRNATPKTITLASGTVTGIEHNADGSKTIKVGASFQDKGNSLGSATISNQDFALTTIPRASQPTCNNVTLGNSVTINTNRASNSFTHTISIKIGTTTVEGPFYGVGASKSWTPSIATYAPYITTNPPQRSVTIECITYNNGTNLGTKTTTCVLTVPQVSSGATQTLPDCVIKKVEENNATMKTLNWGVYVKGKSELKVTIQGKPKYNTSMDTYTSTVNGETKSGSFTGTGDVEKTYTTGTLTSTGSTSIKATVKDKRGFTSAEVTQTYSVVDYGSPQIKPETSVARCDSNGNIDDNGTYVKYVCKAEIYSVSNNNFKQFVFKYKELPNGQWQPISTWSSSYVLNEQGICGGGNIDVTKEYLFRLEATDQFTTTPKEMTIGTGTDLLNFNASGKSMAIGGVSQRTSSEKALDIYTTTYFHENVDFLNPAYFSNYDVHNNFVRGKTIEGGAGTLGYFYVCDITNGDQYPGQFLEFTFLQRNRYGKMILRLSGNNTSGAITGVWAGWIATMSSDMHAYYTLSNNKVSLYVQKSEAYDSMDVLVRKGNYEINRAKITWVNTTVSSLPSGASEISGMTLRVSVTGSAGSAGKATNDNANLPIITNYAKARNTGATSFDDVGSGGKLQRAGLYTESIGGTWYNLINVRHRNGESDGTGYGLQIRSAMTTSNIESARLQYRNQYTANGWTGWQTITPDSLRGCAMLNLTSNWSFSGVTAWANVQVAFSGRSTFTNSNSTIFEQSGNGIKCKFAGWVQVVGAVGTDKTNEFDAGILKGSTQIIRAVNTGGRQSFVTGICQVASGDIIYLSFASGNTSGTIYNTTHFTITRVS